MGALEGRVAIITGGGNGIGAAVSRYFAKEGAKLVINDLGANPDGTGGDAGPAERVAQEIRDAGGEALSDGGDIADVATGERLVAAAVDTYGKLDVVVNVAGILRDKMIFNLEEKDWDAVIRVHLKGHYSTLRPATAYWREQRNPDGNYRIINFTSASGLHGNPGQPNYAAAKMGISGLTWSLARGLGRYGVTANAIAPVAATRLTATVGADPADGNPAMSPDNIAPIVAYIASERSSWMTSRILAAGGNHVGLYNLPEEVAAVDNDQPWTFDGLAEAVEHDFRPIADGVPTNGPWTPGD
ncbi:SDR family NAD(P)-dependent oxidoreductase [Microbacterium aquimaris]|uniref:SDR family NAD(P)-dependent oxidoreductase n=1 Tax=Microbacterium aquimaris TaxID=459816 RepID=UPI002AD3F994|nr:SDR family NAD(P)-dependent oxidoreductase [Microbacterium aquimaris]MDZ8275037.1 SDR family NAD(P)-dependent oxidoreductase [Microbacterium aquimaris]